MHKRYLVFTYDTYYPLGGLDDMVDSFDDLAKAIEFCQKQLNDYVELYDRIEGVQLDF